MLPKNSQTYVDSVIHRCESLVEADVWAGLPIQRLQGWCANFETEAEKFLSARILDSLIYRSSAQTDALIAQLIQRSLPDLAATKSMAKAPQDWCAMLRSNADPNIRVVSVVSANDPPSKSGPSVARLIKRRLQLNDRWIRWPAQISDLPKSVHTIVFVDDFLGTGFQFQQFFRKLELHKLSPDVALIYAPLVAHERGVRRLTHSLPSVHLAWAEILDDSYNLFSKSSKNNYSGEFEDVNLVGLYAEFLNKKGFNLVPKRVLGYGKLGLCFSFEHGTPNATLPLLWLKGPSFEPLFTR